MRTDVTLQRHSLLQVVQMGTLWFAHYLSRFGPNGRSSELGRRRTGRCEDIGRGGPILSSLGPGGVLSACAIREGVSKTPWTLFHGTGAGTERRETLIEMNDMLWNMR